MRWPPAASGRARSPRPGVPGRRPAQRPELLRKLELLALIVRLPGVAVQRLRPLCHALVFQPADALAVLEQKRHFVRADFEHAAAAAGLARCRVPSEPRIEESGVVHAKFAGARLVGEHLGGEVRRDRDRFLGHQDVELVGIEDQPRVAMKLDGLPVLERIVVTPVQVDPSRVLLGTPADERALDARAPQVDGERQEPAPGCGRRGVDDLPLGDQLSPLRLRNRLGGLAARALEPELVQPGPRPDHHAEATRGHLEVELALVSLLDLVKQRGTIGD